MSLNEVNTGYENPEYNEELSAIDYKTVEDKKIKRF